MHKGSEIDWQLVEKTYYALGQRFCLTPCHQRHHLIELLQIYLNMQKVWRYSYTRYYRFNLQIPTGRDCVIENPAQQLFK